ncbi:MAG: hypothetical protein J6A75_05280 [Lachnospiraceae bacterium]|nr:hypothetical protein [Lachnospiraceae bacterium]
MNSVLHNRNDTSMMKEILVISDTGNIFFGGYGMKGEDNYGKQIRTQ